MEAEWTITTSRTTTTTGTTTDRPESLSAEDTTTIGTLRQVDPLPVTGSPRRVLRRGHNTFIRTATMEKSSVTRMRSVPAVVEVPERPAKGTSGTIRTSTAATTTSAKSWTV